MQYVKFGNTGMDVSRICLGMMSFGKPGSENGLFPWAKTFDEGKDIFRRAIDLGINYFDTANVYQMGSSEEITGRFIREFGLNRDEIVVATKVHFPMRPDRPNGGGSSRKNILAEIDHSLRRLQLDYVDVYQIHRLDHETPMEEIMEALHDVVKSGKARYIGASTIFAWQLERMQNIAERHGWTRFASLQPQYNLIYREEEREILPLCRDRKMAVVPWSPLAGAAAPVRGARRPGVRNRWSLADGLAVHRSGGQTGGRHPGARCEGTWQVDGPGSAGVDAEQAGNHCAHRGGHVREAHRGSRGCTRHPAG